MSSRLDSLWRLFWRSKPVTDRAVGSVEPETLWPPSPSGRPESVVGPSEAAGLGQRQKLLLVCRGAACRAAGADTTWERCLDRYVSNHVAARAPACVPVEVACARRCDEAPVVLIADAVEARQGVLAEADVQSLLRTPA